MKYVTILALVLSSTLAPNLSNAQSHGLAAVVNNEPITAYDLSARLRLAVLTLRVPDRPEIRRRLAPQVLRQLILERLRVQEARRLNLKVTREQVARYILNIERQRGIARGSFLNNFKRAGVDPKTVVAQLYSGLMWNQVVARRIAPQVRITDAEIDEVIARMQANKNRVQYRLREIFLPVASADRNAAALRNAQQLMVQLRRGVPFAALARQFSGSSTAAVGGDRGTVFEAQLEPNLLAAVKKMRPGQIVGPIRTVSGYYIVQLVARGTLAAGNTGAPTLSIANVGFRLAGLKPAARTKAARAMATIVRTAKTCPAIMAAARRSGATIARWERNIPMRRLSPPVRRIMARLKVGQKSQVIRTPAATMVFMRCKQVRRNLPTRAAVRRSLVIQKINIRSQNYLRDLRRAAIIEIRV